MNAPPRRRARRDVWGELPESKYTAPWAVKRVLSYFRGLLAHTGNLPRGGDHECPVGIDGCLHMHGRAPDQSELWHSLHPCVLPPRAATAARCVAAAARAAAAAALHTQHAPPPRTGMHWLCDRCKGMTLVHDARCPVCRAPVESTCSLFIRAVEPPAKVVARAAPDELGSTDPGDESPEQ